MKTQIWHGFISGTPHSVIVEHQRDGIVASFEECEPTVEITLETSFGKVQSQLTGVISKYAHDAVKNYMKAKGLPLYLFAKDANDRPKYFALVRDMEKHGWKVVTSRLAGRGGHYWELAKK